MGTTKLKAGLYVIVMTILMLMFNNCGRPSKLPEGQDAFASSSGVAGFDLLYTKIFKPKCLACHTQFASYNALMSSGFITAKNPEASRLHQMVSGGQMPKNGTPLSTGEVKAIYDWISNGSPETTVGEAAPGGSAPVVPPAGSNPPASGAISPTFAWIQANVLTPRCILCHRGASSPAGYDLSSYDNVMAGGRVLAGNSTGSTLFQRINNNSMPPGGPALSAEVKQAIATWIQNGAKNDAPVGGVVGGGQAPPPLPPLEPKFSSIMANIIATRCLSCHDTVQRKGGVVLQQYSALMNEVESGRADRSKLYEVLQKNEMPASGPPLSFEQKETVRQWINMGAANN